MAIIYPLAVPVSPTARNTKVHPQSVAATKFSPFTLEGEGFEHLGQGWAIDIELPPMDRVQAAEQWRFIVRLAKSWPRRVRIERCG